MSEYCEMSNDPGKEEAVKRRKGRLRWRAARMAVILGGFLYEGKKELDEEDARVIGQSRKWLKEAMEIYSESDGEIWSEASIALRAIDMAENKTEIDNESMGQAFDLFTKIAAEKREEYFLDKLINTHCEGYCMIKYLSGEFKL